MASSKRVRVNSKRLSTLFDETMDRSVGTAIKTNRKRKLSDMLGPQWRKKELERFYKGYRKYGMDWKKVARKLRDRSVDMVEALFNMNKAYLSLPEGTASAAGLVAMMKDHCNILVGSDSDYETKDVLPETQKPQKRVRGNSDPNNTFKGSGRLPPVLLRIKPAASKQDCLSMLRELSGDRMRRARGRRTPRFPVVYSFRRKENGQNCNGAAKTKFESNDSRVVNAVALTLAEVSKKIASAQMLAPAKGTTGSIQNVIEEVEAELSHDRIGRAIVGQEFYDSRVGIRMVETHERSRDRDCGTVYISRKEKKRQLQKPMDSDFDNRTDIKVDEIDRSKSCKEGFAQQADEVEDKVANGEVLRSSQLSRRRREQRDSDESDVLEALSLLSEMRVQVLAPSSAPVSGKGNDAIAEVGERPHGLGVSFTNTKIRKSEANRKNRKRDENRQLESINKELSKTPAFGVDLIMESKLFEQLPSWTHKRKHVSKMEVSPNKRKSFLSAEIEKKGDFELSKSLVPCISRVHQPAKSVSRRKMYLKNNLACKKRQNKFIGGKEKVLDSKNELAHCLSSPLFRRWCTYEWFYNAIDFPWFAKNEFVEYLHHAKLNSLPSRLTRAEWGVIRSALGKPRRLSEQFLSDERKKLREYRDYVRGTYADLSSGVQDGLPSNVARPLAVGQQVTAWHPKTRELHDGAVLTVDGSKYMIKFDKPELGVEFIMDVDCMPLNRSENMPKNLIMQDFATNEYHKNHYKMNENSFRNCNNTDSGNDVSFNTCQHLEKNSTEPKQLFNALMDQAKGSTLDAVLQAKATLKDLAVADSYGDPCQTVAQPQVGNAENKAFKDLSHALDKKIQLLSESNNLDEGATFSQKQGSNYGEHKAKLNRQLKIVNEQLSSFLDFLNENSHFSTDGMLPSVSGIDSDIGGHSDNSDSFDDSTLLGEDISPFVAQIYSTSKQKARTMVDVEVETAVREGNLVLKPKKDDSPSTLPIGMASPADISDSAHNSVDQNHKRSCMVVGAASTTKEIGNGNNAHVPLDLMSSCVTTLLTIQACTEQQYPPGDVAQILQSAVTSLHPCCPDNLPLYREIEQCMGIIKTQVLALVPSSHN